MECGMPSSQPWNIPITQNFYPVNQILTSPPELSRLRYEKEILENGLANCVTYLQALRKKQVRNERRLSTDPSLPRKKRKKLQQSKRELEKEIRNREQDEQAFLDNLQAVKTNIYIAETASSPSTTLSLTVPDLASSSTQCFYPEDSEPTELSWNGWTDDTVMSPFQKQSNNPFFVDDIAPDDGPHGRTIDEAIDRNSKRASTIVQYIEDVGATLPVPPNTAQSLSMLSPNAAVFQPYATYTGHGGTLGQRLAELHLSSSLAITALTMKALELERRRVTDVGLVLSRRQSSLAKIVEEAGNQTWANTTPQRSPNKDTEGGKPKNTRTNSL
jgi:hypothetical protein